MLVMELNTNSWLDNSYYLHDGMTIDTQPLKVVQKDYMQVSRYLYYIPSLQQFETILG